MLYLNLLTVGREIPRLELKNKKISISLIRAKAGMTRKKHPLSVSMHHFGLKD